MILWYSILIGIASFQVSIVGVLILPYCLLYETSSISGFGHLIGCRDFDTCVGTLTSWSLYGKPRGAAIHMLCTVQYCTIIILQYYAHSRDFVLCLLGFDVMALFRALHNTYIRVHLVNVQNESTSQQVVFPIVNQLID